MKIRFICNTCGADPPVKGTPKEIWQYCQQHPHCKCGGSYDFETRPKNEEVKQHDTTGNIE